MACIRSGIIAAPRLEHQHIPEKMLPVAAAGLVLRPFLDDRLRLEQSPGAERRRAEKVFGPILERTLQPLIDGHAETHLRPGQQSLRHIFIGDLPQQPFAHPAPQLEALRQAPG